MAAGVAAVLAVLVWAAKPSAAPPPAEILIGAALRQARAQQKTVLIEFGASWCTWCRKFDAFVHASDTGPIVGRNYVIVNLVVQERDDKRALEHPGAQARMDEWGGRTSGLPFYVFLDGSGRKLANSNAMPDGTNIGFPAVPAEVAAFMALIDQTAHHMNAYERQVIEASLLRAVPPPSSSPN